MYPVKYSSLVYVIVLGTIQFLTPVFCAMSDRRENLSRSDHSLIVVFSYLSLAFNQNISIKSLLPIYYNS